ncbi:outer membrane protein [Labrys monachus]|uniref:Outer membrane immunogenic protein n=1 Tax=Labrys monachus TaxID=217067 RepID=A0ABU0FKI0_9HYPH|nr:outer membrane protein [Labrys monachus]MDQ0394619.1 outer membrane immunogenic protein [Labrys monachus]
MALKKSILVISLLAATTLSARAADLAPRPVEPTAPEAMPFTWTGFYVGLNAGYGVGSSKLTAGVPVPVPPPFTTSVGDWSSNGAVGGAQAGYNYQFNSFVVGAEIDGDFSGISGDLNLLNAVRVKTDSRWLASARLRAGFAVDRALFYVTGGIAGGEVKNSVNVVFAPQGLSQSKTEWGWTAGLGIEYAITDNWSARLEYRHVDLGDSTQAYSIANVPFSLKYKNQFDIGTVGVNYRF